YHSFADQRALFGVPNFWNVISNLPFLVIGAAGLFAVFNTERPTQITTTAWTVFFIGTVLTGLGSGWYHLQPDNDRLLWDRLPMTLMFMSLFSIILAEKVSLSLGRLLLWPLLAAGVASVVYWAFTEGLGQGDLRPYALVQFLPGLLIPVCLFLSRNKDRVSLYIWALLAVYVAAKIAEYFDAQTYAAIQMGGHALKHLLASGVPLVALALFLFLRRERSVAV
ncbi:MAG: ceramidase domain-containing protein, partial [Gammaproteobacteria bacterium]